MKIMIRADDLGYSEAINYGIEKSVKEGIVNNVGVMVNMPASFHGSQLLKNEKICFGQHTNICVGKPLTKPELIPSITTEDGYFKSSKEYRNAKEDFVVLEEVILEIEAQYEKFKELMGFEPQYFEGHAIESANFQKGLEIVAKRHNLKYSGISFDGPITVNGQKVYIHMKSTIPDYLPFEAFLNMVENSHEDGYDMMILHPGYIDNYLVNQSSMVMTRPLEVDFACSQDLKKYLSDNNIELYTYDMI